MTLKHIEGRIVASVDSDFKNWHTFKDGTKIRLERDYNNFNRRETQPVNGIVVSSDYIPKGAEVLIHHNSLHDVNRIFDSRNVSGEELAGSVQYYSIPEVDCFAWRGEDGVLVPCRNFEFALRVYEPYNGALVGIEPTLIKNVLYITTGDLKGFVAHVLKASDYEIVFQGQDGREERVIRIRHSNDETFEREEVVAIDSGLTEKVNNGELIVGLTPSSAN